MKKNMNRVLLAAVSFAMTLSSGAVAFADNTAATTGNPPVGPNPTPDCASVATQQSSGSGTNTVADPKPAGTTDTGVAK